MCSNSQFCSSAVSGEMQSVEENKRVNSWSQVAAFEEWGVADSTVSLN